MPGEFLPRRSEPHTYFVGRRPAESAEVYAVTANEVKRLGADAHDESPLDWHGSAAAAMELSGQLLARAAKRRPSRDLQARFALYFVPRLPHRGFVLDAEEVCRWLRIAGETEDSAPSARQSWAGRLRTAFHGPATQNSDA